MDAAFSSAAGLGADQPAPGQSRYGWLAASLRARITRGEWVPGTALPAEAALAREHGVALGTLRQALALLVAEGLLERQHGRGTFVRAGLGGASMLRFFRFRHGGDLTATFMCSTRTRLSRARATRQPMPRPWQHGRPPPWPRPPRRSEPRWPSVAVCWPSSTGNR